ncbi:MAG TPA: hypothetical protein VGE45_02490 [Chloroflexia bacterium]|jgi:hypothetical protein
MDDTSSVSNLIDDRNRASALLSGNSDDPKKNTLMVLLAEYDSLRKEVLSRVEALRQAFNYLVVLFGATISGVIYLLKAETLSVNDLTFYLPLLLPLGLAPLGIIFLDNEFMIYRAGFYIYHHLGKRISDLVGEEVLLVEALGFGYLSPPSRKARHILEVTRRSLFVAPSLASILFALYHYDLWWGHAVFSIIFVVDCVLTIVLLGTFVVASLEMKNWRQQTITIPMPKRDVDLKRIPLAIEQLDGQAQQASLVS